MNRNYFLSNLASAWIASGTTRSPRDAKTIRNTAGDIEYVRLYEGKGQDIVSFAVGDHP